MPFDRTVGAYIERKQAIATDLTTREMQELSCQIRERAFWSATVNNAKVVNTMQRACADFAKGNLSMSDARLAIQKALDSVGYKPADGTKGSIRDLNTFRRQDLICAPTLRWRRATRAMPRPRKTSTSILATSLYAYGRRASRAIGRAAGGRRAESFTAAR